MYRNRRCAVSDNHGRLPPTGTSNFFSTGFDCPSNPHPVISTHSTFFVPQIVRLDASGGARRSGMVREGGHLDFIFFLPLALHLFCCYFFLKSSICFG
jgi:hypothetical protein